MSDTSPILSLPYILPAQAQKHVTHNEALRLLDILVQLVVKDRDQILPPAVAAAGDCHIVGVGATGPWAGQDDAIALYEAGQWQFLDPKPGWRAHVLAENRGVVFDAAAGWQGRADEAFATLGVGVDASADTTNRLVVSAAATLLNNAGAGHQLKINKATATDTASLLFQTGFSGRAEMGLAGSDGFAVKVSADGSGFAEALSVDPVTAQVRMPQGLELNGPLTGAAVTQVTHSTVAGRLLKVGDYGWGQSGNTQSTVLLNAALTSGVHQFANTDPNKPIPTGGAILVIRYAHLWVSQIAFGASTTEMWLRRTQDNGATWSPWLPLTNERGSNANGDYVRFADGTMICSRSGLSAANASAADGALFKSANVTWTFPAAFVVAPRLHGAAVADPDVFATPVSATTLQGVLRLRSTVTKSATQTFGATAVGRWY